MLNVPRGSKFYVCLATFFCFLGALGINSAHAKGRLYGAKPMNSALATGCGLGMGPQYQSYDPRIGRFVGYDTKTGHFVSTGDFKYVDFNPLTLCRKAASICESQPSGQHCCINACRQTFSGFDGNLSAVAQSFFQKCTLKCPGLPTIQNNNKGLENRTTVFHTATFPKVVPK